ncbi:hypothetical protein [Streptomyces decoyicus]
MPALDHRLIQLKALPDGFQAECSETSERGQTGCGEDSLERVEVFRMVGLDVYPPTPPPWFHFEDPILPKHGDVDVASAEPYQVGQGDGAGTTAVETVDVEGEVEVLFSGVEVAEAGGGSCRIRGPIGRGSGGLPRSRRPR